MSFLPQNSPFGKGFEQAFCDREGGEFRGGHPARIGGVVARPERAAGHGGRVIPDVDDVAVPAWAPDAAQQSSRLHHEARFLLHLPDQRLGVRLARLYPPARYRPEPRARLVPALDQQQAALSVLDDGTDARDHRVRHIDKYLKCHPAKASGGTVRTYQYIVP